MKDRKSFFKEWLEKLQQESWQLELLISGLALFGIFESKTFINAFEEYLAVSFFEGILGNLLNYLHFILEGAWYIFVINLVLHIVLRGFWIGAIGLRYVSEDIDFKVLNLSKYFEKLFKRRYESYDDYIEEIEAICSVIFAWTFLLFFILISATLFFFFLSFISIVFPRDISALILMIVILFGIIVFIDLIFLNPIKRIKDKTISRIYGPIFRFYSTITLSFLYRPLLLNFLDNKFTKRLFAFSIPYGFIIIFLLPQIGARSHAYFPGWGQVATEFRANNALSINPYLYDDKEKLERKKIEYVSLNSDRISSNTLEFFYAMRSADQRYLQNELNLEPIQKTGLRAGIFSKRKKLEAIDSLEQIHANNIRILSDKRNGEDGITEEEWLKKRSAMEEEHQERVLTTYKNNLTTIRDTIFNLTDFYIDEIPINEEIQSLFYTHPNMGEKGWKCFVALDSFPDGLHYLKLKRKNYNSFNRGFNVRTIEIPFILDKN